MPVAIHEDSLETHPDEMFDLLNQTQHLRRSRTSDGLMEFSQSQTLQIEFLLIRSANGTTFQGNGNVFRVFGVSHDTCLARLKRRLFLYLTELLDVFRVFELGQAGQRGLHHVTGISTAERFRNNVVSPQDL